MLKTVIARQFRKPAGVLGFLASKIMDKGNLKTIEWVFSLLNIGDNEKVLEIGYGSGILIDKLAMHNDTVRIFGVDFSKVMFDRAQKRNRTFIKKGNVTLSCGSVLDYQPQVSFDKIIAINVIYFWDDLIKYSNKLYQMLNDNGKIYLYLTDPETLAKVKFTTTNIFNKYTPETVIEKMKSIPFKSVKCEKRTANEFKAYCIIAEK